MSREKYNARWPDHSSDLDIELSCIANNGRWQAKDGRQCGAGMIDHLFHARKLIWPNRYRHRWTELLYHEFVQNDITIMMGAASTQKTSHASEFILLNYWARPHNTLAILSTITVDKLDTGVYGEVKMLWQDGRRLFPDLPGNLLESKRAIVTDSLDDGRVRDMRKGIVSRACFASGTLIDTPRGKRPIESLRPGDQVFNACGVGYIQRTHVRLADQLLRITLVDGRTIDCTEEHPFLTRDGWKNAGDITSSDQLLSTREALSILRKTPAQSPPQPAILFDQVPQQGRAKGVRAMPRSVLCGSAQVEAQTAAFLWSVLRSEMEYAPAVDSLEGVCWPRLESSRGKDSPRHLERSESAETSGGFSALASRQGPIRCRETVLGYAPPETAMCLSQERSGKLAHPMRTDCFATVPGSISKYANGSHLLPGGPVLSSDQARRGIGRGLPPKSQTSDPRPEAGCDPLGTRVESVTVLKRDGDQRFSESEGGYRVYNLQVSGHPSYSVDGLIVHNCYVGGKWVGLGVLAGTKQENIFYLCDEIQFMAETFIGAWPNLFSNGNVKILGSGNPKHDPDDQLGIAAEPKEGWTSQGDNKKTAVWETQFMGGRCVNLVGIDSPNFDVPEGELEPFPKLIGRKFEKRIRHDYSENSPEYFTQVMGVMRIDMADARVITRQLCRTHLALVRAIWKGTPTTKVYGLDPSYGGGDKCIKTVLEFGESIDGEEIIEVVEQGEIVIDLTKVEAGELVSAEDQIANTVAEDLKRWGIPPENAFYDPYGKGTMGFAFARKFGANSPIPIDSGGQPTERPVRDDLYVQEADGKRRLKTCREHYSKFVTEAWFSVRYAIEAKQLRNLPTSTMLEGCARKYETVAGNRISVESKDDYKLRVKHSPNDFDSLTQALEGARQRGFHIARLGKDVPQSSSSLNYFEEEARKYDEALRAGLLTHTPQIN